MVHIEPSKINYGFLDNLDAAQLDRFLWHVRTLIRNIKKNGHRYPEFYTDMLPVWKEGKQKADELRKKFD